MKQTDEELAKEYAGKGFPDKSSFEFHNQYTSFLAGLRKGRELGITDLGENLSHFNDFLKEFGWYKLERGYYQVKNIQNPHEEPTSFSGLYNSQEFAEYLKQFEK